MKSSKLFNYAFLVLVLIGLVSAVNYLLFPHVDATKSMQEPTRHVKERGSESPITEDLHSKVVSQTDKKETRDENTNKSTLAGKSPNTEKYKSYIKTQPSVRPLSNLDNAPEEDRYGERQLEEIQSLEEEDIQMEVLDIEESLEHEVEDAPDLSDEEADALEAASLGLAQELSQEELQNELITQERETMVRR
ncbi:MAG: hypothetical protein ISS61_05225 [Desulfobacteraceae bacterium]|nr:hypothetical protein [Desulfobacteraceae bacterium]